jgi:hypothetical protein
VLKTEMKLETEEYLRSAHGMRATSSPSWREIYDVLRNKTIVGEYNDGWIWRRGWVQLLTINLRRWKITIYDWVVAERMGKALAEEIRKEIDQEIIAQIQKAFG